jgi:hypothetical protein
MTRSQQLKPMPSRGLFFLFFSFSGFPRFFGQSSLFVLTHIVSCCSRLFQTDAFQAVFEDHDQIYLPGSLNYAFANIHRFTQGTFEPRKEDEVFLEVSSLLVLFFDFFLQANCVWLFCLFCFSVSSRSHRSIVPQELSSITLSDKFILFRKVP